MFGLIRRKKSQAKAELEQLTQQYNALKEEQALLAKALALMGLNPNRVIDQLRPGGDPLVQVEPFLMSSVMFDSEKAAKAGFSENSRAWTVAALDSLRMPEPKVPQSAAGL